MLRLVFFSLTLVLLLASASFAIDATRVCQVKSAKWNETERLALGKELFGADYKLSKASDDGTACCVSVSRPDRFGNIISDCFCICPGEIENTRWGSLICQAPYTAFIPSSDVSGGLVANCDGNSGTLDPIAIDPVAID